MTGEGSERRDGRAASDLLRIDREHCAGCQDSTRYRPASGKEPGSRGSIARPRYRGGPKQIEVVVADNSSSDATARIAAERGCDVVTVAQRSIAAARNAGALRATVRILAFVDADSVIHPETFNAIATTLDEEVVVGATGIRMSRSSPGIRASMFITRIIIRLGNVDTGGSSVPTLDRTWKTPARSHRRFPQLPQPLPLIKKRESRTEENRAGDE